MPISRPPCLESHLRDVVLVRVLGSTSGLHAPDFLRRAVEDGTMEGEAMTGGSIRCIPDPCSGGGGDWGEEALEDVEGASDAV
jgi:hypothetical protein